MFSALSSHGPEQHDSGPDSSERETVQRKTVLRESESERQVRQRHVRKKKSSEREMGGIDLLVEEEAHPCRQETSQEVINSPKRKADLS